MLQQGERRTAESRRSSAAASDDQVAPMPVTVLSVAIFQLPLLQPYLDDLDNDHDVSQNILFSRLRPSLCGHLNAWSLLWLIEVEAGQGLGTR